MSDVTVTLEPTEVQVGVETVEVVAVRVTVAGPPGPAGAPGGPPGPQGEQGPPGPPGQDGAVIVTEGGITTGEGDPDNDDGEPEGNVYIDLLPPNNLWLKEGGVYVLKTSIRGSQGPQGIQGVAGTPGADGRTIYSTNGVPSPALGQNGDVAIDYVNGHLYDKTAGSWVFRRSIVGPAGANGAAGPAGADGEDGNDGWSPIIAIAENGADRVLEVTDWVGGEGTKPATGYVGSTGLVEGIEDAVVIPTVAGADGADGADGVDGLSAYEIAVANGFVGDEEDWLASLVGPAGADGADGADGAPGADGEDGADGWSPILSVVTDGERRVLQIVDWTGGTGTKPSTTDQYIGPTGIVGSAASAVDIRGAQGPAGADGADGADGAPGADGADGQDAAIDRTVVTSSTRNLDNDDGGKLIYNAGSSDHTLTIRTQANYAWSANWQIDLANTSTGRIIISAQVGVTLVSVGNATRLKEAGSSATLVRLAENLWLLTGDLEENV